MLNKVSLIGRVGRDPEVKHTQSGAQIVNLRLATTERWKSKAGEREERTTWHSIVVFNEHIGKIVEAYVRKGSLIFIEGALQTRNFVDKDGAERNVTEIVLQRFRGELTILDAPRSGGGDEPRDRVSERSAPARSMEEDISDDIPFAPEWR